MAPLRPSGFAGELSSLDREAFVAFVSDLWEARGRTPRLEDGVLIDDAGTCLLVHHASGWRAPPLPSIEGREGVDGIVTNRRVDAPPDDARVIDADDLREMVLYAVGHATREDLLDRHFDRPQAAIRRPGDAPSGAVSRRAIAAAAAGVVVISIVAIAAGALGGLPVASEPPAGESVATAASPEAAGMPTFGPSTPRETPTATATPSDSTVLAVTGEGELPEGTFSTTLAAGDRPLIVEFDHRGRDGFFVLWIRTPDGERRRIAGGNASEGVRALLDINRGRSTLIVGAVGRWRLRVRRSVTYLDAHTPDRPEYAGPVTLSGPTNITFRGLDPNATYSASLLDRKGNVEARLDTHGGSPAATVVSYRGEAFVRVDATGRWIVVFDRLEGEDSGGAGPR